MPTRWDDIFDVYSGWTVPESRVQQPQMRPMQERFQTTPEPEYNMNPMQRYTQYLSDEPMRDAYKPGKFGSILNGLSAGFESMDSGSIGQGAKLFDYLQQRPYIQARSDWESRGNKVKADVELENTRYRNAVTAADRAAQRANQERTIGIQEQNANTAMERLELERKKFEGNGWELRDGPGNTQIRINTRTGESQPTDLPNRSLTAEQQINQFNKREEGLNQRHNTASGSARLGASTSRANTTDIISSREKEGKANREVERWRHTTPNASVSQPKEKVATPTNTRTAVGLIENGYPEFNDPDLVRLNGQNVTLQTNPDKIHQVLKRLSGGDLKKYQELDKRFEEFSTRLSQLGGK